MSALIYASGEAAGSSTNILIPPVYEIFYSALAFLLIWIVVGKYLPKIYKMLDDRKAEIEAGLGAADAAKEEAALAARERRELLREANEQARATRERADQDAVRIVAEARNNALAEAARVADNAEKQLAADRKTAEITLRREIGELATDLAEKIIGEHLANQELTARVIDRFMDDLEADLERSSQTTGVNN